jgi:hypothetical protein
MHIWQLGFIIKIWKRRFILLKNMLIEKKNIEKKKSLDFSLQYTD